MQRNSLGKYIWYYMSPLVIRYAIAYIVEFIVIGVYTMRKFPNAFMGATEEQTYEYLNQIIEAILPYSTQIGAVAALITIPCLIRMMKKDGALETTEGYTVKEYIYAVIMSIAIAIGLNNILLLANVAQYSESYQESAELLYSPSIPMQIICLGIIYPIMEELLFRGLIFRRIRKNANMLHAVISSALFFGVYHGNSVQMIYGTLCGLMLAYFCEKSGSMKVPILGHIVMNMTAIILTALDAYTWMFHVPVRMVVITILCAAVGSSMFVLLRQKINP